MKRTVLLLSISMLATVISASVHLAEAQAPAKVPRIGFLRFTAPSTPRLEAFREGLREQGYIEGQNIIVEYRYAEAKKGLLPSLAAELVDLKVDVIAAIGPAAARAAKNATRTIPIVFGASVDPVAEGFVASLGRPGGNITGVARIPSELAGKKLELLKETVPRVSRVAFFWNPETHGLRLKELEIAARSLQVELLPVEFRGLDDLDSAFQAVSKGRVDALMIPAGFSLDVSGRKRIVDFAANNRLPSMVPARPWAEAGGLMSYASPILDLYRRAGFYVGKILKGASPADLPVERPTKFELIINLKTAKKLGITIPPTLLLQATKVIK